MDPDDLAIINDEPFGITEDEPATFLIRVKGEKTPFAVVCASDMEELFWTVDEITNPKMCECSVVLPNEGFFVSYGEPMMTEGLEDRVRTKRAWRPVDDGTVARLYRMQQLAEFESEVSDLTNIFKNLKRKANDRFNRHGRRSRKDAVTLEKA